MGLAVLPASTGTEIEKMSASQRLIEWTLEQAVQQQVVLTTGFGMEGCALVEMYAAYQRPLEVVYLDTGFFFPETYDLIERLRNRHPHLDFVDRGTRMSPHEQAARYGEELWKENPDLCCQLRKVDPMAEVLGNAEIWVTGLRRGQSRSRSGIKDLEWSDRYRVLKVSPLADWSREQVWDFIQSGGVPYNPLHEQGYPSIGCTHCTRPVAGLPVGSYSRAGRWVGLAKTECGLHNQDRQSA